MDIFFFNFLTFYSRKKKQINLKLQLEECTQEAADLRQGYSRDGSKDDKNRDLFTSRGA